MARSTARRQDKGVSLARVPALVLGSLLLAFGLLQLLKNNNDPRDMFPDGTVNGSNYFGIEGNGWTGLITAVAGGLLLFGAAQHHLAKTMSLIVGLALGACSVIALVDGDDVLGLAAANGWTALGWGAASAFLLINTLLPRKGGHTDDDDLDRDRVVERPVAPRREAVATERVHTERDVVAPGTGDRARTQRLDGDRLDDGARTQRLDGDRLDDGTRTQRLDGDRLDDGARRTDTTTRGTSDPRGDGSVADDSLRDDRR